MLTVSVETTDVIHTQGETNVLAAPSPAKADRKSAMRCPTLLSTILTTLLVACVDSGGTNVEDRTGSDRDNQGCITSAGYSWCQRTASCERPWELARQQGVDVVEFDLETYCSPRSTQQERVRYHCELGTPIEVLFSQDNKATLYRGDDIIELSQARTASGFYYTNGKIGIRGKGNEAMLEIGRMAPVPCRTGDD